MGLNERPLYDLVSDAIVQAAAGPFPDPAPLSYYEAKAAIEALREGAGERLRLALESIGWDYIANSTAELVMLVDAVLGPAQPFDRNGCAVCGLHNSFDSSHPFVLLKPGPAPTDVQLAKQRKKDAALAALLKKKLEEKHE